MLDQSPPYQPDTGASLAVGGLVARIRYPLNDLFTIGGGLAGGARIGKVEGDTRVRPYAALSVTASAEL